MTSFFTSFFIFKKNSQFLYQAATFLGVSPQIKEIFLFTYATLNLYRKCGSTSISWFMYLFLKNFQIHRISLKNFTPLLREILLYLDFGK